MTVVFGTLFALQNNPVMLVVCGFMITWSNAWLTISYHAYRAEIFRPGFAPEPWALLLLQPPVNGAHQHSDRSDFTIRRHPGVISFIVASMLMVMLSVGIYGPKTRGIELENI